jgi:hypothetical protein
MRQTWVLGNGGFQLGGQKRPGRAREREWPNGDFGSNTRKGERGEERQERRDQDPTRAGTTRKNWERRAHRINL